MTIQPLDSPPAGTSDATPALPKVSEDAHAGDTREPAAPPATSTDAYRATKENHPLFVIAGAVVVAGGIVAGIMQYFHTQQVRSLETTHASALQNAVRPLNTEIDQLKTTNVTLTTQLGSVKRTVSGDAQFFDVRDLFVKAGDVKALPASLKYYDDQRIYVSPPPSWKFSRASELDLVAMIQGDDFAKQVSALLGQMPIHEKNLLLWRGNEGYNVTLRSNIDPMTAALAGITPPNSMKLFPFVGVQRFDRALLSKAIKVIAAGDEEDEDKPPRGSSIETAENNMLEAMERAFAADLAGVMMTAQSQMILGSAQVYKDTVFSIENVEKRGPVLYMNARIEFRNAKVAGMKGSHTVRWDREVILAALDDTVYMIMTSIPTVDDGRSSSYGVVQAWLTDLRIPAKL